MTSALGVSRVVRPKTIALTAACLALAATLVVSFAMRTSGAMSVQHDRDPLTVSDGSVRNAYTVKLLRLSSTICSALRVSMRR